MGGTWARMELTMDMSSLTCCGRSMTGSGVMRCVEAATGNEVWQERVGGEYYASPIYGDGRIYCSDLNGKTTVLKAGRKFEAVATNSLADGFMASPAVTGKALILRTKKNLYRIETDAPTPGSSGK